MNTALNFEPIHTYTRNQAISDGVLVDVSSMASEAGFRLPVAMTQAAWLDSVEWTEEDTQRQTPQDQEGRLWDVLWMARLAASKAQNNSRIAFQLYRVPRGGRAQRPRLTELHMTIGPGDTGEPVITIMQPHED
ncbi:MAG: DUF6573 family protein [Pseudomonadota bacterium]